MGCCLKFMCFSILCGVKSGEATIHWPGASIWHTNRRVEPNPKLILKERYVWDWGASKSNSAPFSVFIKNGVCPVITRPLHSTHRDYHKNWNYPEKCGVSFCVYTTKNYTVERKLYSTLQYKWYT